MISIPSSFKKTEVKLELLTDTDVLFKVEEEIRRIISNSINRYGKANNKYMKHHGKNRESSYVKYWDVNNLYGWKILQQLPVNGFVGLKKFLNLMKAL